MNILQEIKIIISELMNQCNYYYYYFPKFPSKTNHPNFRLQQCTSFADIALKRAHLHASQFHNLVTFKSFLKSKSPPATRSNINFHIKSPLLINNLFLPPTSVGLPVVEIITQR